MFVSSVKEAPFMLELKHCQPYSGTVVVVLAGHVFIYIPQLVSALHALYREVLSAAKPAGGFKPASIAIPYFETQESPAAKNARVATRSGRHVFTKPSFILHFIFEKVGNV
jgi:hypothetical protein